MPEEEEKEKVKTAAEPNCPEFIVFLELFVIKFIWVWDDQYVGEKERGRICVLTSRR